MLLSLLAASLAAAPAQDPKITTQGAADGSFTFTVGDFDAQRIDEIQDQLKVLAERRCGALSVRWGKFSYAKNELVGGKQIVADYVQKAKCYDPATDPYQPVPADWQPTAEEEDGAITFAQSYIEAVLADDFATGLAMAEPGMELDTDTWDTGRQMLNGIGTGSFGIYDIGWAANPDGMPHPGAFALVHFRGDYSKVAVMCGWVVVYRAAPDKFLLTQQRFYVVTHAQERARGGFADGEMERLCRD
ncbi:hypothetical protein ACFQ1E_11510 [Sphingomonas canadensis]|uniref:DUF1176 domain-containing protein n=1 Tax=Sphingomonas canadensis TaxID=1219257 RepID=A0ABW3H884_9SPHN|nr:hypothetical protein [Sphingomonas canadensis]MCW3836898.1 hypothetical protein [Sphingomonas canadensis]